MLTARVLLLHTLAWRNESTQRARPSCLQPASSCRSQMRHVVKRGDSPPWLKALGMAPPPLQLNDLPRAAPPQLHAQARCVVECGDSPLWLKALKALGMVPFNSMACLKLHLRSCMRRRAAWWSAATAPSGSRPSRPWAWSP